jgi:hypothetical protein
MSDTSNIRTVTPEQQEEINAAFDLVRERNPEEFDRLRPAINALAAALTPDSRLISAETFFSLLFWLARHSDFGADADGRIVPVQNAQRLEGLAASMNELSQQYPDFSSLQRVTEFVATSMNPIWGRITPGEFLEVAYLAAKHSSFAAPVRDWIDFEAAPVPSTRM